MSDSDTSSTTDNIDAVEFYWRPGCPFCAMLERDLDAANIPLRKRNIWDEPSAAEFVRSVADGNETVPTIFVGGQAMVNPPISAGTQLLSEVAPHLVSR
jgi:glutaredoxin